MRSRTATAIAGLLVSLVVSVGAWYYFDTLLVFFFLPFVPILFRRRAERTRTAGRDRTTARDGAAARDPPPVEECPRCGFRTQNPEFTYCPRDGTRLETVE